MIATMTETDSNRNGQTPELQRDVLNITETSHTFTETLDSLASDSMTDLETEMLRDAVWLGQVNAAERHGVSRSRVYNVCRKHRHVYIRLLDLRNNMTEHTLKACEYYGAEKLLKLIARREELESVADGQAMASIVSRVSGVLDRMVARKRTIDLPPVPTYDADVSAGLLAAKAVTPTTLQE